MTTIRQPRSIINIESANVAVGNTAQRILFVGQKTPAGTALPNTLVEDIANGGAEDGLFGPTAMISTLIRANKIRNQEVASDAICLDDDVGSTQATGQFAITGTASEAGTYEVIAGSESAYKYQIAVSAGEADTSIRNNIASAINTVTNRVVDAVVTTQVDITAINGGTYGNSIPLEIRGTIAGLTTGVTPMSGGVIDPNVTNVFDVIGDKRYQAIVWPYPDNTAPVRTLLDARFNNTDDVLNGRAFTATNDTYANLLTLGTPLNSQSLVIFGGAQETETNYGGGDLVEIPMVKAAQFAGYAGLRLDPAGFGIADLVISSNGQLDNFGGPALASLPYFNTPFANFYPIKTGRGFTNAEIEGLKDAGITVIGNNRAANTVIAGEVVTTYKTDSAGNPDPTFGLLNYVDTISEIREYFSNNLDAQYAQSRLTEGDLVKGRNDANENSIRAYLKRLYLDLSGPDYVLVENGEAAVDFFLDNLVITIDKAIGRVSIQMQVPIVTQLREIIATIKVAFSVNQ